MTSRISPCLWFKEDAEEAAGFYVSLLPETLADQDREKARRVMQAMLRMGKLDIAGLQAAHDGKAAA